ncbi:MAG: sporulation transcriptional regulator SpoIIID [Eubacteriales bacterium]
MIYYNDIDERCVKLGQYVVENKSTVRDTAKKFNISKSTVHKDITEKLSKIDFALYEEVEKILQLNKSERHIRGGEATKRKYQKIHFQK